jgi:transposase-like protein
MPGRPSVIDDPENARAIAEMFVAGNTRQEIADAFGVQQLNTVTKWRRDPRVKAIAMKLIEDRVLEVTRKVDAVIAARLQNANEMTTKELLEIRKEFLGGALRQQHEKADDDTVHDAMNWLDQNPEQAALLADMLAGRAPNPVADGMVEPSLD